MKTNQIVEVKVEGGIGRVWEARAGHWSWAHPDGSEGCNEPTCEAAIAAVESQNAQDKVKIFGWDLTAQAIKAIDGGYLTAVVQQDPGTEGKVAVESLLKLLKGEKVDAQMNVPITIVTKENVDQFRSMFK